MVFPLLFHFCYTFFPHSLSLSLHSLECIIIILSKTFSYYMNMLHVIRVRVWVYCVLCLALNSLQWLYFFNPHKIWIWFGNMSAPMKATNSHVKTLLRQNLSLKTSYLFFRVFTNMWMNFPDLFFSSPRLQFIYRHSQNFQLSHSYVSASRVFHCRSKRRELHRSTHFAVYSLWK